MNENTDKFYNVALKLVKEAGKVIKDKLWQANKTVMTKASEIDFVTETDQQVEKRLINGLSSVFPEHKFIGEESTAGGAKVELTSAPTWIIDPIDGTMNFVHGNPNVCISIALLVNKITEIGIVYNPVVDQLFTARKGQGAFLNGRTIKASGKTELSKSLLCLEFGANRDPEKMKVVLDNVNTLYPMAHGIRATGSCALNMSTVALGGVDAYCEFGIHAWDIAAGDLLVREAGGVVIDPAGGPFDLMSCRMLCAATPALAEQLAKAVKQYYPPRDI